MNTIKNAYSFLRNKYNGTTGTEDVKNVEITKKRKKRGKTEARK